MSALPVRSTIPSTRATVSERPVSRPNSPTDSATVRSGENPLSWSMIPIRARTANRSVGLLPKTRTSPDDASRCPSTTSNVEVLPAPLVPSSA